MNRFYERLSEVEDVLAMALECRVSERASCLDRACAGDAGLREMVERALAEEEGDSFLAPGGAQHGKLWEEFSAELTAEDSVAVGERFGAYQVKRVVGRGGMGVVCLADRIDGGFEQSVALKVLAGGANTGELRRLFDRERQILAALAHPGIARLLDGGVTPGGRPYFAMEPIEGRPIDEYCDKERLSIAQRLRLFREVVTAVSYAHQNLVVHRDIKPSNILVTARGEVKLLDFGIAKASGMAAMLETNPHIGPSGSRLMTPEFASPEQVRGERVSTPSDIYQLGLLLYLLLCGCNPHRISRGETGDLADAVCERLPPPPSELVARWRSTNPVGMAGLVCRARRTTAARMRRMLRGDLDEILLRALQKCPHERYESAERFGDEIDRYLTGRPVTVRPNTPVYLLRKCISRNRLLTGALTTFMIFGSFAAWRFSGERRQALSSAANAREIAAFTNELLLLTDPGRTNGDEISAEELLAWGARRVSQDREASPEVRAAIMSTLGNMYRLRGMYREARPLLEEAVELQRRRFGARDPEVAAGLHALADLSRDQGRFDAAESLYRETLAIQERALGTDHPETAGVLDSYGNLRSLQGRYSEAEDLISRALSIRIPALGQDHPETAHSLTSLAVISMERRECGRALRQFDRALGITRNALGDDHPQVATILTRRAFAQSGLGDLAAAEEGLRRALTIRETRLGPRHPEVFASLNNLGILFQRIGRYQEAEALYLRALDTAAFSLRPDHPRVAFLLNNLCSLHLDQNRASMAAGYCERSLAIREQSLDPFHPAIPLTLRNLARLRQMQGRSDEAVAAHRRMLAIYEVAEKPQGRATTQYEMAVALTRIGRLGEAEAAFRESLASVPCAAMRPGEGCFADGLHEAKVYLGLGMIGCIRGEREVAEESWRHALDVFESQPPPPTVAAIDTQARLLLLLGRRREAGSLVARLEALGWHNPDLDALHRPDRCTTPEP